MAAMSRSTFGLEPPRGENWRTKALCREDPDAWFDPTMRAGALHICRTHCTVRVECLEDARACPPRNAVQGGIAFSDKAKPVLRYLAAATCSRCTAPPVRAAPGDTGVCGAYTGYRRHLRRGEAPCDRCKAAAAQQRREHRKRAAGAGKQQKEATE